jgi:glc operon protein GlcG
MKSKAVLMLDDLKKIAAGAEAEANKNNWKVSIAICDDGGHLLFYQRLDGASPISSHIAPQKARTAAIGRRNTKIYEDMVNGGRYSALSMPEVTHLEGGVPIVVDGEVIGAVGVSGVKSSEDAQIAEAGIKSLLG